MKYILPFLYLLILGCGRQEAVPQGSIAGGPDQESWGVTIILTDKGIMRAKIKSGHLEKYNEREFVLLDNSVTVDFFDDRESHTSQLTSLRAEVNQSSNDMKAMGHVVAVSDSGISLYTDTLIWNSSGEKMTTDDPIMLTTEQKDTLYGIGFESDSDLKNWKILKPSGVTNRNEL